MRFMIEGKELGVIGLVEGTGTDDPPIPPVIAIIITEQALVSLMIEEMEGQDPEDGVVDLAEL
jgi:hypothetical protein